MSELENNLRTEAFVATNMEQASLIQLLGTTPEEAERLARSHSDRGDATPLHDGREVSPDIASETALAQEAQVESQQTRAQVELQSSAAATSDARAMNARRNKSSDAVKPTRPVAEKPKFSMLQAAGAVFALLGTSLMAAPKISTAAADWLAHHSDVRMQSGTLLIVGVCLWMAGFLRNTLRELRGSLEVVRGETARLGEMAKDGQSVRSTLNTVRGENSTLSQDIVRLQAELTRLVEIVENPDYTMSIFRLAASVDQLGKHVEMSMKAQFELLEPRVAAVAQHVDEAERQLSSTIVQMSSLAKEQHRSLQLALKEGLDELHSAAEVADTRSEQNQEATARLEALLQSQDAALSEGLANLGERGAKSAGQIASNLDGLRERFDRQIEKQAASWLAEFLQIGCRLDQLDRSQSTAVKQIREHVDVQLGVQAQSMQQGLKSLADDAGKNSARFDSKFDALAARIEQQAREQQAALQGAREQTLEATRSAKVELTASLEQLGLRVDEQACEQQATLAQTREQTMEATRQAGRELAAGLEQLGTRVEQEAREHEVALQQVGEQLRKETRSAKGELAASLEQLGKTVDQELREQQSALGQASEATMEVLRRAQSELVASLDQLWTRVDERTLEQQLAIEHAREQTFETVRSASSEQAANFESLKARLDESEREQLANSRAAAQQTQEANAATKRELSAKLEQVESHLEQLGREQLAAVRKTAQEANQAAATAKRELEASMAQLRAQQEQQAREHQAGVQQASVDAQQTTTASRRELAAIFEQVGGRIEKAVAARADELAGDLLDVSAILIFNANEVRTCIAETLGGLAAPNSDPLAEALLAESEIDCAPAADVPREDVWMSPSELPAKPAQSLQPDWLDDASYPPDEDRSWPASQDPQS